MADYGMEIEGADRLIKATQGEVLIGKPLHDFLQKSVKLWELETKERTPVDTGRLRSSVTSAIDARPVPLWGKTGTNVFYALYVEFGTRPHFPPPSALSVWASRHGNIPPFVLARAISRRGTKGAFMFKKAFEASKRQLLDLWAECGKEILSRWQQ